MAVRNLICRFERNPEINEELFELFFKRKPRLLPKNEFAVKLTPVQRQALEARYQTEPNVLAGHERIGDVRLFFRRKEKIVQWSRFFPLGADPSSTLLKKGIGSRIHHAITEHAAQQFSNYHIIHDSSIELPRLKQLQAMGIDPYFTYAMPDYLARVREFMTEQKKKGK